MPGYGFAFVDEAERETWRELVGIIIVSCQHVLNLYGLDGRIRNKKRNVKESICCIGC